MIVTTVTTVFGKIRVSRLLGLAGVPDGSKKAGATGRFAAGGTGLLAGATGGSLDFRKLR